MANQTELEKYPVVIESVAFSLSVNCSFNNTLTLNKQLLIYFQEFPILLNWPNIWQRYFHLKFALLRSFSVSF